MKYKVSKTEVQEKIKVFFNRKKFKSREVKKIKTLAMSQKIKLGSFRRNFCKKCLSKLKGRLEISKTHKTITCSSCGFRNKLSLIHKEF